MKVVIIRMYSVNVGTVNTESTKCCVCVEIHYRMWIWDRKGRFEHGARDAVESSTPFHWPVCGPRAGGTCTVHLWCLSPPPPPSSSLSLLVWGWTRRSLQSLQQPSGIGTTPSWSAWWRLGRFRYKILCFLHMYVQWLLLHYVSIIIFIVVYCIISSSMASHNCISHCSSH